MRQRSKLEMPTLDRPVRFMGREYVSKEHLAQDYPAFAAEGPIRAMRAGCTTVQEVEAFCWKVRNRAHMKNVQAARRSRFSARQQMGPKA